MFCCTEWSVRRMLTCKQDSVIIALRGEGLVEDDDEDAEASATNQRLSYALHPNCGIFDVE